MRQPTAPKFSFKQTVTVQCKHTSSWTSYFCQMLNKILSLVDCTAHINYYPLDTLFLWHCALWYLRGKWSCKSPIGWTGQTPSKRYFISVTLSFVIFEKQTVMQITDWMNRSNTPKTAAGSCNYIYRKRSMVVFAQTWDALYCSTFALLTHSSICRLLWGFFGGKGGREEGACQHGAWVPGAGVGQCVFLVRSWTWCASWLGWDGEGGEDTVLYDWNLFLSSDFFMTPLILSHILKYIVLLFMSIIFFQLVIFLTLMFLYCYFSFTLF